MRSDNYSHFFINLLLPFLSRPSHAGFRHNIAGTIFSIKTLHPGMKKVPPCLYNILKKQPTRAAEKKILPKYTDISKFLYIWIHSSKQKKLLKITSSSVVFLRARPTWQQCIQNIHNNLREVGYKKRSYFWFHKVAKFMKRSKKVEFGSLVLFTIFTNIRSSGITCSVPHSGRWGRNYSITSTYPVLVGKNLHIKKGQISSPLALYPVQAVI